MSNPTTHRIPVSGGESIVADWIAPSGASPVAVFIHGFGSHRRGEKALYFAGRFAERGWGFLAVDLRGHGESDGAMRDLTMTRMLEDVDAAMTWLPARTAPRLLIGSSMGGSLAAWHCAGGSPQVRGVAMIAPSLRFPAGMTTTMPPAELAEWRRSGVLRLRNQWLDVEVGYGLVEDGARYDPERLVREYRRPTLIFHGMRDEAVDWRQSLRFTEQCAEQEIEWVLIKNGDHRLTGSKAFLFDTMLAWWAQRGLGTERSGTP